MTKYILLSFIVFSFLFSSLELHAQTDFFIKNQQGEHYLVHKVRSGESLYQLSADFYVSPSVLIRINNFQQNHIPYIGDEIKIPLVETNFFRSKGVKSISGFRAVSYMTQKDDDKLSVLQKFQISEESFDYWNNSTFSPDSKVIIGWVKYTNDNVAVPFFVRSEQKLVNDIAAQKQKTSSQHSQTKTSSVTTTPKLESNQIQKDKESSIEAASSRSDFVEDTKDLIVKASAIFKKEKSIKTNKEELQIKSSLNKTTSIQKDTLPSKNSSSPSVQKKMTNAKLENNTTKDTIQKITTIASSSNIKSQKNVVPQNTQTESEKTTTNTNTVPAFLKNNNTNNNLKNKSKSKVVWEDFKSSFKQEKKQDKSSYFVKQKSNNNTAEEKKSKKVWEDFKASFKNEDKKIDFLSENKATDPVKITKDPNRVTASKAQKRQIEKSEKELEKVIAQKPVEILSSNTSKTNESKEPVSDESKPKTFANTKLGSASYFFAGPAGAKYYVATNLAQKGEMIKVVNPDNNNFIIAEVIAPLPSTDITKGVIIKVSDNAKIPLGQKNTSFQIKVHY